MKLTMKLLAVTAALLTLCAPALAAGADSSLEDVLTHKKLVLGLDPTFAPMGFTEEDGSIVGFDIDVAREVCNRLNVELVCQPIAWEDKEKELKNGTIDCIWNGMSISPDRMMSMLISTPYMRNAMILVVRADSGIQVKAELAGKRLGVQGGSTAEEALEEDTRLKESLGEVAYFEHNIDALQELEAGKLDAVLVDLVVADYYIATEQADLVCLEERLMPEEYGIGFRKKDQALHDAVDEKLFEMDEDGTLARISEKWFGHDLTTVQR